MSISFFLFNYFPHGGLQRDFMHIALECQRRGASIRVYTLSWDGPVPEGFDVRLVPVRALTNHGRVKRYSQWVEKELLNDREVVRVGFNKVPGMDLYYAADGCYREKVMNQRSMLYRMGARYRLYERFERAVFSADSRTELLMISKAQAPLFTKHYGTPVARMHFLPPNISRDRVAPENAEEIRAEFRRAHHLSDEQKLVIQVGSGFVTKGVDRSIHAIAALPDAIRKNVLFWVVGADRKDRFEKLACKLGVAEHVVFTGGRNDIPQVLLGADLMMHPAYNENTGTALLEAVVAGLPVICSGACGYSGYIADADCGRVIPEPFEQAELNRQLETLLTDGNLPALGEKALAYAKVTDLYSMHERATDIIFERLQLK